MITGQHGAAELIEAGHFHTRPHSQDPEDLAGHAIVAEGQWRSAVLGDDRRLGEHVPTRLGAELHDVPSKEAAAGEGERNGGGRERHHQELAANRQVAEMRHDAPRLSGVRASRKR